MSAEISINFYLFDLDSSDFIVIKKNKYNSDFDFVRKMNKNIFVQTTIISYDRKNLKNDTLWEQFKENFVDWIENDVKEEVLNIRLKRLRNALRKRSVWILKDSQMIIAKFLIRILDEEHLTFWIEEEIVNSVETFNSNVINLLRKIEFERNLIDYSWQTQSRSESQKSKSARQSSFREQSTQSIQLLNKEKLSIRQRSSSFQSIKQRFSSSQSIKQRSLFSIFESLNRQRSFSIELRWIDQQFSKWDSSIKFFVLKKSRRSTLLRSFIESSFRSILAFFILSSSSSISRRAFTSLFRFSISSIQKKKSSSASIELIKSIASIRIESDHEKELANLIKLYTKKTNYSDENDSFSFKLTIFHDMCDRVDVLQSIKLKTFFIMLKELTLDYYYSNMNIDVFIIFDEVCFSTRNYFEDAEYRRNILFKWNNLILRSMMTSN
jgi:hypothetical protein